MPTSWQGVLMLMAVTAITLVAEAIRRYLPPPRYRDNIPVPWPVPDLTLPHPEDPKTAPTPKTTSPDPTKGQDGEEEVSI